MKTFFLSIIVLLSLEMVLHWDQKVKMRDGVELETRTYYTTEQWIKKNPVMLMRTPYGTGIMKVLLDELIDAGFIVVIQDIRGMLKSKGTFSFFRNSGDDNIDTMTWIKSKHWSNGDIGTIGFSAPGITQYMSVDGNPYEYVENPVFQCIEAASIKGHEHIAYQGGAIRHSLLDLWLNSIKQGWYYDILVDNEAFSNEFWGPMTITNSSLIHWPAVHLGGWYDIFSQGIIDGWKLYRKNPEGFPQYIVMTSGGHCGSSGMDFPHGQDFMLNSYDYCPKLFTNASSPPLKNLVNFYVVNLAMNGSSSDLGNFWVSMKDFPNFSETKFFLNSNNELSTGPPSTSSNVTFDYDPNDPTPTEGGNNLLIPCGPRDQSKIEQRKDNVIFTTSLNEFDEPTAIVGRIKVNLVVSTNRNDTDFVCRLSDYFPETGESLLLNDGIVRMKWLADPSKPTLLQPYKKYEISIDLWSMAAVISKGHALRLTCTSSNYPRFSVNGNSGKLLKDETKEDFLVAKNTLYYGDKSYVSIPIVDLKLLQEYKVDNIVVT